MGRIFNIILVIIGALIGAGFASGQEIYSFFYIYGINGILGISITCILLTIVLLKTLNVIYDNKIDSYRQFLDYIIKNKKVDKVTNFIINMLLLITFYIMIAGFGAYFEQEIMIPKIIGSIVLALMCYIVFLTNVNGVLKVSKYIVPILIICVLIIGIINFSQIDINEIQYISQTKDNWISSAIIYCSYNLILLIPVLITLRNFIKSKKDIRIISIATGVIIFVLSIIIFTLLMKIEINIQTIEMPVVYVIRTYYAKFKPIYAFIILASIFTTAISLGIGLLQNIELKEKSYPQIVALMCISSLPISYFGFSKLVNFIYPLFGYIGIIQILLIMRKR